MGFNHFWGVYSIFEAELWGILNRLIILHDREVDKIFTQTHSLEVV